MTHLTVIAMRRLTLPLALALVLGLALSLALTQSLAGAQEAGEGRISGSVVMATSGAELAAGAEIELIELSGTGVSSRRTVVASDGTYAFAVPIDPDTRFIPRVEYQGVQYFGAPIILTAATPTADADPITVYEATDATPELTIRETVMTAVALDRREGQIGFIREDLVVNPTDRAYIGASGRITLRIPAPEATLDAAGENADGQFALQDGILTTTTPIRALDETAIITRFLVDYDVIEDRYTLRVTVPVAAEQVIVRIPQDYVRRIQLEGEAQRGPDETITASSGESVTLDTFIIQDARPGDSLVLTLDGLAIQVNRNPIAETPGNIVAPLVALALLAGAGVAALAYNRRAIPHSSRPTAPDES